MIKGEAKEIKGVLSREAILEKVDDYNIYRKYLGDEIDFKKKYSSPFREGKPDNKPNLCFFPHDSGKILFKDFARGIGGDCFKFVQELFGLNFYQTLEKIDVDFNLGLVSKKKSVFKIQLYEKPDSIHKQTKLLQIEARDFTSEELAYWDSYKICRAELIRNNVFSINKLWINKKRVSLYSKELRFAYKFDDYLKIYTPFSMDYKWISSTPNDFMSGFDDIRFKVFKGTQDKKLIVSKSLKDEMILKKFFPDVCSTQNESSAAINTGNMQCILQGYKPEDVYIAYDNDEAGREAAEFYVKNYGFNALFTPNSLHNKEQLFQRRRQVPCKDWGELVRDYGLEAMENLLSYKKLI